MRTSTTRLGKLDLRGLQELVDRGHAEAGLGLLLELGLDARDDVRAELVERVELGGRRRERVVERGQHPLVELLQGDRGL